MAEAVARYQVHLESGSVSREVWMPSASTAPPWLRHPIENCDEPCGRICCSTWPGTWCPSDPTAQEPRAVKRRPKAYPLLNQPRRRFIEISHRSRYWKGRPRNYRTLTKGHSGLTPADLAAAKENLVKLYARWEDLEAIKAAAERV
jgi:hypothetical protein